MRGPALRRRGAASPPMQRLIRPVPVFACMRHAVDPAMRELHHQAAAAACCTRLLGAQGGAHPDFIKWCGSRLAGACMHHCWHPHRHATRQPIAHICWHITVAQALSHGDFGLGTLNLLDGEVVVLDGHAYQQDSTGATRLLSGSEHTPFMALTHFNLAKSLPVSLAAASSWEEITGQLQRHLRSRNVMYAIRVHGKGVCVCTVKAAGLRIWCHQWVEGTHKAAWH